MECEGAAGSTYHSMMTPKMKIRTFFLFLLAATSWVACERTPMNTRDENLLRCKDHCMPLRISGQYRVINGPASFAADQKLDIYWAGSWYWGIKAFSMEADERGTFGVETQVDTSRFDDEYLLLVARIDTSLFLGNSFGNSYEQERMYEYQPDRLENLTFDVYRKAFLLFELVRVASDSFRYLSVRQHFLAGPDIVIGTDASDDQEAPLYQKTETAANLPIYLTWEKIFYDDTRETFRDTLLPLAPDEVRTYRIAY